MLTESNAIDYSYVMMNGTEEITTSEVARQLGLSRSTVRTLLREGLLPARLVHSRLYLVPASSVEAVRPRLLERRKPGRPWTNGEGLKKNPRRKANTSKD